MSEITVPWGAPVQTDLDEDFKKEEGKKMSPVPSLRHLTDPYFPDQKVKYRNDRTMVDIAPHQSGGRREKFHYILIL